MATRGRTRFAVLGILSLGPASGYDIRKTVRRSLRHFWNESPGQIYPTLRRLARIGLIRPADRGARGRGRRLHRLTPSGLGTLRAWLRRPLSTDRPLVRNELLLKLFFGARMGARPSVAHLQACARQHSERLKGFLALQRDLVREHRGRPDLPYWLATLKYGIELSRLTVRWSREAATLIETPPGNGEASA